MNPQIPQSNNKKRAKLALWLMIAPTVLFAATFICYAIVNFVMFSTTPTDVNSTELFATQNPVQSVLNVILFITGVISFLAWLPGIITGIVLLATKK